MNKTYMSNGNYFQWIQNSSCHSNNITRFFVKYIKSFKCYYSHQTVLQVSARVSSPDGNGVAGITFWDGPDHGIWTHDYVPEPDWTVDVCGCCNEDPVSDVRAQILFFVYYPIFLLIWSRQHRLRWCVVYVLCQTMHCRFNGTCMKWRTTRWACPQSV
jgi:hypothetical protein